MPLIKNRMDRRIRKVRERLEDTKINLENDFGKDSELYKDFLENAYTPLRTRIADYLDGTTDIYPLPKRVSRELKSYAIGALLFLLYHGILYIGETKRLEEIEKKYGKPVAYIISSELSEHTEDMNMLHKLGSYVFYYGQIKANDVYKKNVESEKGEELIK